MELHRISTEYYLQMAKKCYFYKHITYRVRSITENKLKNQFSSSKFYKSFSEGRDNLEIMKICEVRSFMIVDSSIW